MSKLLFIPFSVIGGILAGFIGKKTFELVWGAFDDEEAPEPGHREISLVKLILALIVQGAIFRAVRGLVDHGSRHAFQKMTGSWPGEEQPEQS
ncbi:MAG: DUF4235 domain-containing protein [Solirubrobacterales bacterium]|nr:DUF4235 domain-containing protein [Solirubrobacterales bacterium]MBV9685358.1 DUF4235 domain-containing protein [Solirubrobacterales bacterium]MBV9806728.1 DUF4235 domain-containing protein [Solirubrobacterales bacterium]